MYKHNDNLCYSFYLNILLKAMKIPYIWDVTVIKKFLCIRNLIVRCDVDWYSQNMLQYVLLRLTL
jgi:hypothetical protein